MVVIGSQALRTYTELDRIPRDLDLVGSYKEMLKLVEPGSPCYPTDGGKKYVLKNKVRVVEFEITWPGSTAEMIVNLCGDSTVAPIELLLALKMSHRFKKNSKHFLKTMDDIRLMRSMGVTVPDKYLTLLEARTAEALDYAHPKLSVSKAEFFSPVVKYVYDHDSIHMVMKHQDRPAYEYFKPPGSEVLTSRLMFEQLPIGLQLNAVLEEAYVLALERSQIPYRNKIYPRASFLIALEKVCTSITSGWFREFAWEHYYDVLKLYHDTYVSRFWAHVGSGKVMLHHAASAESSSFTAHDPVTGLLR
jgi:hypothetical protein